MKKILLCSEFFHPNIGGVEYHNKILYEFFKKKKNDVYIATSHNKNRVRSSKVFEFKISGNFVRGFNGETDKYQKFLIREKFDIIFFNAAQQWSFDLALPIISKINCRKILFPCGFSRINNFFYKPYFKLLKSHINYFDEIICSHKNSNDYKFLTKIFKKKIHLINNGAFKIKKNNNHKKYLIKKYKINDLTKIFINISNIKYGKGQDRVIKLFETLKIKNSILFLMGNNYSPIYYFYIKYIIDNFNKKNTSKKIILVQSDPFFKNILYSCADFFLFGSRIEYDPLVMYESIMSQTKFVSYNVGSCKFFIKKNFGVISNNIEIQKNYIYKNLINIVNNKQNFNKFDWNHICKKYNKIFFKK